MPGVLKATLCAMSALIIAFMVISDLNVMKTVLFYIHMLTAVLKIHRCMLYNTTVLAV